MLSVIPVDRSKDAWVAVAWKQEWDASPRIGPMRRGQGGYLCMKTWGLADSAAQQQHVSVASQGGVRKKQNKEIRRPYFYTKISNWELL